MYSSKVLYVVAVTASSKPWRNLLGPGPGREPGPESGVQGNVVSDMKLLRDSSIIDFKKS